MKEELVTLQISASYRVILRQFAQLNKRSMKKEFEWIMDQEQARRYSQPNPVITVEEAQAAADSCQ
jgi:hypothetical protein